MTPGSVVFSHLKTPLPDFHSIVFPMAGLLDPEDRQSGQPQVNAAVREIREETDLTARIKTEKESDEKQGEEHGSSPSECLARISEKPVRDGMKSYWLPAFRRIGMRCSGITHGTWPGYLASR